MAVLLPALPSNTRQPNGGIRVPQLILPGIGSHGSVQRHDFYTYTLPFDVNDGLIALQASKEFLDDAFAD